MASIDEAAAAMTSMDEHAAATASMDEAAASSDGELPPELAAWYGTQGLNITQIEDLAPRYRYCLLYTSPSPRDQRGSRMPSSA